MVKELVQILAYVREMETREVPESADATIIVKPTVRLAKDSEENAQKKEQQYN